MADHACMELHALQSSDTEVHREHQCTLRVERHKSQRAKGELLEARAHLDELENVCTGGVEKESLSAAALLKANSAVTYYQDQHITYHKKILFIPDDFALKLKGMNGDHAEDQQKTFRLMGAWKDKATFASLANSAILTIAWDELCPIIDAAVNMKVMEAGGEVVWDVLSPEEKTIRDMAMMYDVSLRIGKEAFSRLPGAVQQGDRAMQAAWITLGLEPSIILANKDNFATLILARHDSTSTTDTTSAAEERALTVSSRGGVKTAGLAGALFNHKDDKMGQQDTHRHYMWQVTGKPFMFPDTSNTRYQTHYDAAAELTANLDHYIRFLELVRDKKDKRVFNHMEANIYGALHDSATLTELAVLVLYAQAVTHPYVWVVRGPGTEQINILDLGPVHTEVKIHVQRIIRKPELLLLSNACHETGAMDGCVWENPTAIAAIRDLTPRLPHLKPILVAFFRGALDTWEWFTAEFAPGGLIDLASASERETQIDFDQRVVNLKRGKDEEKQKKAAELVERLAGVSVILDPVGLDNLIVKDLKMQLEWHRQWDISDGNKIPKKSHLTNKLAHRIALGDAIERYKAHTPRSSIIIMWSR
ncbi:hypothetical protein B0H21DRAFT_827557 [Amylocystis lapponica]|nr:hypothetical protein B0H21DRAFT_827557 [Amylocystis lapponica]